MFDKTRLHIYVDRYMLLRCAVSCSAVHYRALFHYWILVPIGPRRCFLRPLLRVDVHAGIFTPSLKIHTDMDINKNKN